jgi:hypothetical protein
MNNGSFVQGAVLQGGQVIQGGHMVHSGQVLQGSIVHNGSFVDGSSVIQGSVIRRGSPESTRLMKGSVVLHGSDFNSLNSPRRLAQQNYLSSSVTSSFTRLEHVTIPMIEQKIFEQPKVIEKQVVIEQPIEIIKEVSSPPQIIKPDCTEHRMVIEQLVAQLNLWKGECQKLRDNQKNVYELEQKLIERDRKISQLTIQMTGESIFFFLIILFNFIYLFLEYERIAREAQSSLREKEEYIQKITYQLQEKDSVNVELRTRISRFEQLIRELQEENSQQKAIILERERIFEQLQSEILRVTRIVKEREEQIESFKGRVQKLESTVEEFRSEINIRTRVNINLI